MQQIIMNIFATLILLVFGLNGYSQEKIIPLNDREILTIEPIVNGKIENNQYTCNLFDWKIAIPKGYTIMDPQRMYDLEKKGYEAMKTEVKNGMKINPHPKHLIGFEINKYNYFSASIEPIGKIIPSIEEHKKMAVQLMTDTYRKVPTLKVDISTSDLKILNHDSYKVLVNIYKADTNQLLLIQEIYNTYIGTNLFSASISYTEEIVGQVLSYNFLSSVK